MNKIRTSGLAKFLAWILIAVSGMALVTSGFLVIGMMQTGYYTRDFEEIKKEHYERYSDRYSALVLHHRESKDEYNKKYFADKNFRYGVIKADSYVDLEKLDLNNPGIYEESNFDWDTEQKISLENAHVFQCRLTDKSYFDCNRPNSLGGYYWISNTGSLWNTYEIDRYVYDDVTGIFYCYANGFYYPIPYVMLKIYEDDNYYEECLVYDDVNKGYQVAGVYDYERYQTDTAVIVEDPNGVHSIEENDFWGDAGTISRLELSIYDANISYYVSVINQESVFNFQMLPAIRGEMLEEVYICNSNSLDSSTGVWYGEPVNIRYESFSENVIQNRIIADEMTYIGADGFIRLVPKGENATNYFVVSTRKESLSTYGKDWTQADLYVKFNHVYGTIYQMRYHMIGILAASILLYTLAFVFLCTAAGYKKGNEGLTERWINRVPLEIYGTAVLCLEVALLSAIGGISYYITDVTDVVWMLAEALVILVAGLLLTGVALEVVCRIKLKVLLRNTCIFWLLDRCRGVLRRIWNYSREHMSMMIRMILLFGAIFLVEFIVFLIMVDSGGFGLILLALVDGAIMAAGIWGVIQLQKLKEAGEHVAAGDLDYKVDTRHMYWDFKQHAQHLNNIGDGLAHAVDERMKSERFKTELITNVSHDIKTPLTSIINYVDLIQKEDIDNEKVVEYLEVLDRQSKRLKKLLEDLLEASKASTGTLPVGFETLEAGVFVVQTLGEFEEKMATHDLELIIKKPEEAAYICADGRHFWRVIDNLMNNICKYAQPNTRVYINLEATQEEVFITFRNTSRYALNITSEELLERFVRGDESRHTEGSGLGLSIAQSLMELMNARFELVIDGDLFKVILVFKRVYQENK